MPMVCHTNLFDTHAFYDDKCIYFRAPNDVSEKVESILKVPKYYGNTIPNSQGGTPMHIYILYGSQGIIGKGGERGSVL